MARRGLPAGSGRLAAVLEPWPVDGAAAPGDGADGPPVDATPAAALPGTGYARPPRRRGRWAGRLAGVADRWLPAPWRHARLDPGRPGALALVLVAVAAAALAAVGVWREAPRAEPMAALPPLVETTGRTAETPDTAVTAGPPEPLVVAVAGRVARPGLVRVPPGARVADVLEAAGGPLPDADLAGLNLARKVSDGEQVAVGVPPAPDAVPGPAAPGAGAAAGPAAGSPVDLNAATVEQLDGLPGVGPVTAQRIVEWRTRNGRFATVDQLREVEGIGERRFGQLRDLVRV